MCRPTRVYYVHRELDGDASVHSALNIACIMKPILRSPKTNPLWSLWFVVGPNDYTCLAEFMTVTLLSLLSCICLLVQLSTLWVSVCLLQFVKLCTCVWVCQLQFVQLFMHLCLLQDISGNSVLSSLQCLEKTTGLIPCSRLLSNTARWYSDFIIVLTSSFKKD